jgi:hypothetical protein
MDLSSPNPCVFPSDLPSGSAVGESFGASTEAIIPMDEAHDSEHGNIGDPVSSRNLHLCDFHFSAVYGPHYRPGARRPPGHDCSPV